MPRMIDADALMDIVEQQGYVTVDDIINAETIEVQQWIPVTERPPEENGNYIVTACDEGSFHGEGIWYDTVSVEAEYDNGCWTWYEGDTEYDLTDIVTHWMPFPKPVKMDGGSDE